MVQVIKHEMRSASAGFPCRDVWSKKRIMISLEEAIRRLFFVVSLFCATAAGSAAFGQDDDVIDDTIAPVPARAGVRAAARAEVQFVVPPPMAAQFNPEQIDQWVFNRLGGAAGARSRLDANLALRIDDLDRMCAMTELQKKKLMVAGLGDIKRFYDRVDDLKRRYASGGNPANMNNIWQEMQPLQVELANGLFGDLSLFMKTVKNTLSEEQSQRHEDLSRRRGTARRRASIELFVVQLDKALGLSEAQRGRLIELLVGETPAQAKYGQADYWYFMYQMTRLPEAKITAILDEAQWRLLSRQFMQARGMEPWLKSNGILSSVGGSAPEPSPSRVVPIGAVEGKTTIIRVESVAKPQKGVLSVEKAATGSRVVPQK